MKKQTLIAIAIIVVLIIGCVFYAHYVPIWVLLCTIAAVFVGGVCGWLLRIIYERWRTIK